MKQLNHATKLLTSLVMLVSLLAMSACGKEQQVAAPEESKAEKQVITWKLAQTWGTGFPIFGDAVIKMADMVKEMSGGELEIRIDSANKHKAALGILDMVKAGQYEMGHSASYYWKGKDPNTMFFSTMPFGMIAPEQYAWFYYGGGMELMKKVYDEHGVYSFPGGNTGNQMGGWFRKEINTFDDLDGLKMRVPGFARSYHESAVNWASIEQEYPDVKIRTFSPEIIAAMKKINQELLAESAANNPTFKEILDSQNAYMKMARKWTELSDYAYLKDNLE